MSVRRGREGEFTEVACGWYTVTVSTEEEAARTEGLGHVFLGLVDGTGEGRDVVFVSMLPEEAGELARDLLLAVDLLG